MPPFRSVPYTVYNSWRIPSPYTIHVSPTIPQILWFIPGRYQQPPPSIFHVSLSPLIYSWKISPLYTTLSCLLQALWLISGRYHPPQNTTFLYTPIKCGLQLEGTILLYHISFLSPCTVTAIFKQNTAFIPCHFKFTVTLS